MSQISSVIRTEIFGLDVCLGDAVLAFTREGEPVATPILLSEPDAARLRLEMAKVQLGEWNRLQQAEAQMQQRHKHYLASWLVLCFGALSAYLGYPSYVLPVLLTLLSIFIWLRAGYVERQSEAAARRQRDAFVANWDYLARRLEEEATPSRS